MKFYVGLHQPGDARHFERAFVSINRVRGRKAPVLAGEWILDSGAFSELSRHGAYRSTPEQYAVEINRLIACNPTLSAVVAQDYMCEPFILARTGLTVMEHQFLTVGRYDALRALVDGVYILPVLQGYLIDNYLDHIDMYGKRLLSGAYVGVGSVCKRNARVKDIEDILDAIKDYRPDLQLHGFGLKSVALGSSAVRSMLYSADSMAWSFAARREGRSAGANDWREAMAYTSRIEAMIEGDAP